MSDRMANANWDGVSAHIQDGIRRWVDHGILPGSFLTAVIENDLKGALGKADEINRAAIFEIVKFFWNETPADCWGSRQKAEAWNERGGLIGPNPQAA